MNEELDNQLVEILKSTTESIGTAKEFILAESPEVIQQLLLWYGVYYFILFIVGMALIYGVYRHLKYQITNRDNKFYWDKNGDPEITHLFSLLHVLTIIPILESLNLTWLKIWIAPKIWLIEHTATLIGNKGE